MKRAPDQRPPRPFALARRAPRTRPETAAELVRVEYERDRLERDLFTLELRRKETKKQLAVVDQRARMLQTRLSEGGQH